jgi:predicted ATP-grasp superfamily ATP-dependent carboligase
MNKFTPLFDIPLTKYDTLNEYPPSDEVKRALKAHLVNHSDIPKKPTVGQPSQPITASANTNITQSLSNKKRKREKRNRDRDRDDEQKSSPSEKPNYPHCDRPVSP